MQASTAQQLFMKCFIRLLTLSRATIVPSMLLNKLSIEYHIAQ